MLKTCERLEPVEIRHYRGKVYRRGASTRRAFSPGFLRIERRRRGCDAGPRVTSPSIEKLLP